MVRLEVLLVAALAASLLVPVAAAHEGGDGILNVVASPTEPRVGETVDLTYYLLDDDGLVPHVDTDVQVTQNGAPRLTLESTHEHDGVHHATVRFTEPGPFSYTVVAETDDGLVQETLSGEVLPAGDRSEVALDVQAPGRVRTGEPIEIGVDVHGPDEEEATPGSGTGSSSQVTDGDDRVNTAWVRLYREPTGKLVRRAQIGPTSAPDPIVTSLDVPGTYRLQVEAYPAGGAWFPPTVEEQTIEVEPGPGPIEPDPMPDPVVPGADEPSGMGNGTLHLEIDPTTQVGPLADIKVDALLLDGAHPIDDTLYNVAIEGPRGATVLDQQGNLQPDGIAEWFVHTPVPGTYDVRVVARTLDGTSHEQTASYTVVPPTRPGLPGTVHPAFDGTLEGQGPHEMGLAFEDVSGEPMTHVEADLEAYAPDESAPRWTTKLHAHDHGVAWSAAFDVSGEHYLKVNPSPQSPTAGKILPPGGPTDEIGFGFDVDVPEPTGSGPDPPASPGEPTPWPGILAVAALVAGAVWFRRVRSR